MSVQALAWALEKAEGVPAHLVSLLIGIANHASVDGSGAYPGTPRLARYTRKSERQTNRDLQELIDLKLIQVGDERHVQHIRADRRPTVYDLVMDGIRGDTNDTPQVPRGDTDVMSSETPPDVHDMTSTTARMPRGDIQGRHGVTPTSPEPSTKPSGYLTTSGYAREADPTPLPDGWAPNPEHARLAATYSLSVEIEAEQFACHMRGQGRTADDWDQQFRSWLAKSRKYERERGDHQTMSGSAKAIDWLTVPAMGADAPRHLHAIESGQAS